jgi:hypothetical protein
MWFKTKVKTKSQGGHRPPPAGRPRARAKRTRREDHAFLIVRDEFRTGYSSIGLLASRARLRFTGIARINAGQISGNELSSNGKVRLSPVSHRKGSPHSSVFIGVHRWPIKFLESYHVPDSALPALAAILKAARSGA